MDLEELASPSRCLDLGGSRSFIVGTSILATDLPLRLGHREDGSRVPDVSALVRRDDVVRPKRSLPRQPRCWSQRTVDHLRTRAVVLGDDLHHLGSTSIHLDHDHEVRVMGNAKESRSPPGCLRLEDDADGIANFVSELFQRLGGLIQRSHCRNRT